MIHSSRLSAILLLLPILVSCMGPEDHFDSDYRSPPYASNGERIYFTGTSSSGKAILANGGSGMTGMHRQMHGGGCAICHGGDREGKRMWPRFWLKAPALTPAALFEDSHADHGHQDHPGYDGASLRLAIIAGRSASGEALDIAMPRWTMSGADLDDLVAYLRQNHRQD